MKKIITHAIIAILLIASIPIALNNTARAEDELTVVLDGPFYGYACQDTYINSTVTGGTPPYTYEYLFGDSRLITSQEDKIHIYRTNKYTIYNITLIVTDSDNNQASDTSQAFIDLLYNATIESNFYAKESDKDNWHTKTSLNVEKSKIINFKSTTEIIGNKSLDLEIFYSFEFENHIFEYQNDSANIEPDEIIYDAPTGSFYLHYLYVNATPGSTNNITFDVLAANISTVDKFCYSQSIIYARIDDIMVSADIDYDAFAFAVTSKKIYVDDDADPCWYNDTQVKTIQEGINNASSYGTVFVFNGTYTENVVIDKKINIIGESKENVIIDGFNNGSVLKLLSDNINISRFTIINSGPEYSINPGINISSKNNQITETIIHNNDCGIYLDNSSMNNISDNIIYNNRAEGVALKDSKQNTLKKNIIYNEHNGIFILNSTNNYINNNNIFNCSATGIYLSYSNYNDLDSNIIYKNNRGVSIFNSKNNSLSNNEIYDNKDTGACVYNSNNNSILNNILYNNSHEDSSIYAEIFIQKSCNNSIINNNIQSEKNCIGFYDSSIENIVDNNQLLAGTCSIAFEENCNKNIIKNNNITNNSAYGILILNSINNTIFHNSFINNTVQAYDNSNNSWYKPILNQGNYWDDYTGTDNDDNGIGDSPYNISGGDYNKDKYPLMGPHIPKVKTVLEVSIEKGFFGLLFKKVSTKVENKGDSIANNVNLNLYVKYGILNKENETSIQLSVLDSGNVSELLTLENLRGFGKIQITAEAKADNADAVNTTASGWIIGKLIILTS